MNKKLLLILIVASLTVLSVGARSRKAVAPRLQQQLSLTRANPQVKVQEMQMRAPGTPVAAPVRGSAPLVPFYRRPAGAFYCSSIAYNGVGGYSYGQEFALLKPYSDYTFHGTVDGADKQTYYAWDVFQGYECLPIDSVMDVTVSYKMSIQDMPIFYAVDGDPDDMSSKWYSYKMPYLVPEYVPGAVEMREYAKAYAIPSPSVLGEEGVEYLLSSKTTCAKGRYGNLIYQWTAFSSQIPENKFWWFGKNANHVDGMAQAFEKPEHPYLLKKVYLEIRNIICNAPVDLKCKVYRLDDIPSYQDTGCVVLPEEPGTLIATGEGVVSPLTYEEKNGAVEFTLYTSDENDPDLVYEYNPTIDYPILVVIEGYNDPDAADLVDFTAMVSADYLVDEGYGETAYLKCPINDDEGNFTGHYMWKGLNNFFTMGTMKTAFTIFIVAEHPFVAFYSDGEDGEFLFPVEGGELRKIHQYEDDSVTVNGIMFNSWIPSDDGEWEILWNGSDELPDWLEIKLADEKDTEGEFTGVVIASVTADPLPEEISYREAIVRFQIPGDYIDYKFMQGEKEDPPVGPPDPIEPPVVTINTIIRLIISGNVTDEDMKYDINEDGEITVADINVVIDRVLNEEL